MKDQPRKSIRERFPIPTFPPELPSLFPKLCVAVTPAELNAMRHAVNRRVEQYTGGGKVCEAPHLELCRAIAVTALRLIDLHPHVTAEHQRLIAGAIFYFIDKEDYLPDNIPLIGYDDDRGVINHVVAQLDLAELLVPEF